MEIVQGFLPYREMSIADMAANALGAIAAVLVLIGYLKKISSYLAIAISAIQKVKRKDEEIELKRI
ncbi:VanZ like protein, partial [Candidatus Magnetoovum chiemensis]